VPKDEYLVSKNDLIQWRNPLTARGIALHEFDRWGAGGLQIHECGYLPKGCRWHFNGVSSPFWRFYYNSRAGSHIQMGRRRIPLLPNRVLLVPENTLFHCRGGVGVPHLWIHFSFPSALRFVSTQVGLPLHPALRANLALVRRWFHDARHVANESDKRKLFHACSALLHSCLVRAPIHLQEPPPTALSDVLEYIERSLSAPLTNPILARQVGMSVEGFLRWFREHQGMTPARYVARRRIQEACRLLTLTQRSIEEIAEVVGFANRHHFTRVFCQYTGEGPAQFRRGQTLEFVSK
jgi:AraC-like DNA-binding protein